MLFAPLLAIEVLDDTMDVEGFRVLELRPTVCQRVISIEELVAQRKNEHVGLVQTVEGELEREAERMGEEFGARQARHEDDGSHGIHSRSDSDHAGANLRQSVSRLVRSGSSSAKDAVSLVRGGSSARSVDNRREALEQHAVRARKEPAEHFTDNRNFIRETRAVLDILIGLTPAAKQQRHFFVWLWRLAAPAMLLLAALMLLGWMTAPRYGSPVECRIEELHGAAGTLPPSTRRMSALCPVLPSVTVVL